MIYHDSQYRIESRTGKYYLVLIKFVSVGSVVMIFLFNQRIARDFPSIYGQSKSSSSFLLVQNVIFYNVLTRSV